MGSRPQLQSMITRDNHSEDLSIEIKGNVEPTTSTVRARPETGPALPHPQTNNEPEPIPPPIDPLAAYREHLAEMQQTIMNLEQTVQQLQKAQPAVNCEE